MHDCKSRAHARISSDFSGMSSNLVTGVWRELDLNPWPPLGFSRRPSGRTGPSLRPRQQSARSTHYPLRSEQPTLARLSCRKKGGEYVYSMGGARVALPTGFSNSQVSSRDAMFEPWARGENLQRHPKGADSVSPEGTRIKLPDLLSF